MVFHGEDGCVSASAGFMTVKYVYCWLSKVWLSILWSDSESTKFGSHLK